MLLLAPAIDELCSAAPTVAAPGIQADLGLDFTSLATITLVLPLILGLAVEPLALWLADGPWRRPLLVGSTLIWTLSFALAGFATQPWILGLALFLAGPASGIALGVAQVALLARSSDQERTLHRWTLFAAAGDLAGPLAYAAILTVGGTWRHAFLLFSVLLGLYAVVCAFIPMHSGESEGDEAAASWSAIREALRDRILLIWLLAVALCTLLDEIMVMLCALWIVALPGGDPRVASFGAAAFLAGMIVGLSAIERRWVQPDLGRICLISLAGLVVVLLAPNATWAIGGFFVVGLGAGPQYPMTLARAHARFPDSPGLVSALGEGFKPIDLALPILVGLCADRFGLTLALICLAIQPLGILLIAQRYTFAVGD